MPEGMRRLGIDLTIELADAIQLACHSCPVGPTVEEWLWQIPAVQEAARKAGIQRKPRRVIGHKSKKAG